jgi:glutamate-1-semialdehyde aminotransferase
VTGAGSMIGVHFSETMPSSERDLASTNHLAAQLLRVYLELDGFVSRGLSFLSTAHTGEDVHRLVAAFDRALRRLQAEGALEA